jgi:DNA-binding NarL/FixJ family response regulator
MADRIRVLLVGDNPSAMRTGRADLGPPGLEIVGAVSHPREVADAEPADVLLVADDRWLGEITDAWGERALPALVVLTRRDDIAPALAALGVPGWGVVAPDASGAELAAALVAAGRGFAVTTASHEIDADLDSEEYGRIDRLTARERDVLELVSQGLPNKSIASRLGISDHTVKFHLSSIFSKLGVSSRTEAVRRGVRAGLIDL